MSFIPRSMGFVLVAVGVVGAVALSTIDPGQAQSVVTTPSKKTLEDASNDNCEAVSSVVQRCARNPVAVPPEKKGDDELERSRAAAKAAFDRRDRQGQADALKGTPTSGNTPVGDAQRLGGVTVTGTNGEPAKSVEGTLQKALEQPTVSPNGTVSKYAPNGSRYDCIEKCIGPACCVEVRQLPNPARDSNSIGR
jgi:hypothetical protein